MKTVKNLFAVIVTIFTMMPIFAQSEVSKLPEFATFHTFVNTGNKGDISLSESSGLSARLKVNNDRCFLDEVVQAEDRAEEFVIKANMKPVKIEDLDFCKIQITVTLPKQAAVFGRVGKVEWIYARLNGRIANSRFSFSGK